jgi:hypothetical protein
VANTKKNLIAVPKIRRVSSSPTITSCVRVAATEQTLEMRHNAVRLFCRAMIRLYLRDNGNPDSGNSLGIL